MMKKLTQEEIVEIKLLQMPYKKIGKMFNVTASNVYYHKKGEIARISYRENKRKRYQKMTLEEKRNERNKHIIYQRNYQRRRYHTDKLFKEKHLRRMKKIPKKEDKKPETISTHQQTSFAVPY